MSILIKQKFGQRQTHTHIGRVPCKDKGKDQSDTNQRMPKIARKSSKTRQEAWNRFFFLALRKNQV